MGNSADPYAIPLALIGASSTEQLRHMLAYLNRTRRRAYPFMLNASKVVTTRKWARDAVRAEIARRPDGQDH